MAAPDNAALLAAHANLPEPYQPAWGLAASHDVARRDCEDRLAVILPLLEAWPGEGALRILDLGCAQGYFTLAIAQALTARGRTVEIVGVDYLAENIEFCRALAAYHGIAARFIQATFDAGYFERDAAPGNQDVVLAFNVLHHLQQPGAAADAVAALRAHSRLLLCELAQREEGLDWVKTWPADDMELLGGYAFRRRLADFPTHLGDIRRPLYACSDSLAWIGSHWFSFDRVAERSHPGVPDRFAGQRRFLFGRDTVVKAYRGDGQYGAFNRAELEAEAVALAALPDEPQRYPAMLARADDGDVVWLARKLLPGRLLSEHIDAGEAFDATTIARGLLAELARLEERGFYHNDLRCWNALVDGARVRLIDFGAMVREPSSLQRVALAAVLREIADRKLSHMPPFYGALQPLDAYPMAWRAMVSYVLETPLAQFRYAAALAALDTPPAQPPKPRLAPDRELLTAVVASQCERFQRLDEHVDAVSHRLEESQRYVASLRRSLDASQRSMVESQHYTESLLANHAREMADAKVERDALVEAHREAAKYADALRRDLDVSHAENTRLHAELARMRRRFRWLRPLWPRDPVNPKEPE